MFRNYFAMPTLEILGICGANNNKLTQRRES